MSNTQYWSFSVWLISLGILFSRLVLSQMAEFPYFLWVTTILLYIFHIFFIHSSVDWHLCCFHISAYVILQCIWECRYFFKKEEQDFVSFRYMSRSGIAGLYGSFIIISWGNSMFFSLLTTPIYIPTNSVQGFLFSTPLPMNCFLLLKYSWFTVL